MRVNGATVLRQFIKYLKCLRRYSDHTIIAYKSDLLQCMKSMHIDLLQARTKDLNAYLKNLRTEKKLSVSSVNRKTESIKAFYKYCLNNSYIKRMPSLSQLEQPKVELPYIKDLALLKCLNQIGSHENRKKFRDALIIEVLYYTGCRASEIINLKKADVDYPNKRVKVLGKRSRERFLHINRKIIDDLKKHLRSWRSKNRGKYVFTNDKGKKIYPMYLWRLIRRYLPEEIVGKTVSAHTIRHSIATHLYQKGASMKNVKDFLGHKSYRSTESYVHFDQETLSVIYNRCHPKA